MKRQTAISYRDVDIDGGFWGERQRVNRDATSVAVMERFRETGRFAAFHMERGWAQGEKPHYFWDSDVAKWIEGVAYLLQKGPAPALEALAEETIGLIEQHQAADGYFNIYFTVVEPEKRWQDRDCHELYCAGHLIEAAVAYYEATGRDRFLRCMCRYADAIERVFMREHSATFDTPGHEEIELALVRLWRCTGEARYLRLSQYFVDTRGQVGGRDSCAAWAKPSYTQSHLPVREQRTAEGHAVRALYLYAAMADLAVEADDPALWEACRALFGSIAQRRMYITGGVGSSHHGEAFTLDYDLPNESAYGETCAALALALFARRMAAAEPDAAYADAAERAIYNGFLSGVSLDGTAFFYENPLEVHPALRQKDASVKDNERYPQLQRQAVFGCSCCPPNVLRFIASLGDFLYSYDETTLFVHHYAQSTAQCSAWGRTVSIQQATEYPWQGNIQLELRGCAGKRIALRIPGWCSHYTLLAGDREITPSIEKGYAYVDIADEHCRFALRLEMPVRLVRANPAVWENIGRAAVTKGPLVYCLEG
ncbi:MAG: glycoside hydrolase family 127 protein, partial [Oscillospiraceae bacterium]|nr:glycoside hydrolase family 127 protein [Oscillospiraceae bacterium]